MAIYLIVTCSRLKAIKIADNSYWQDYYDSVVAEVSDEVMEMAQANDAIFVDTAVYLEEVRQLDMKNSMFEVVMDVGFRWEGGDDLDFLNGNVVRFYKGEIKNAILIDESHENGVNYMHIRYDVEVSNGFYVDRYPMENHILKVYIETSSDATEIVLVPNADASGYNQNIYMEGFEIQNYSVDDFLYVYESALLDPEHEGEVYKTEVVTTVNINRSDFYSYVTAIIVLSGVITWCIACLFISAYRKINTLATVGAGGLGVILNVLVDAYMLPYSLDTSLIRYVNLYGALVVVLSAVFICLNVKFRNQQQDRFARIYGMTMFVTMVVITLGGNLALPLSAYIVY